ncbi:MAG: ABC transporter ATP-binding protein [Gammaproteobacteria bacterium]|nr:ABC transporter ATP-binding protein [Gammaproteobacteria bacterium]MDH5802003.1 ABC transporter ATP-binding protein [Gammaproteobacteria bacterium]
MDTQSLSASDHIVSLNSVSKVYVQGKVKVKALDQVSLNIERGDFAALCGPSGSGKTTLLNLIGGLDSPSSGSVFLEQLDLAQLSRSELSTVRRDRIGFVFQAYNLIPVMTAFENAEFVMRLQNREKGQIHEKVMQVLKQVGLEGMEHRRPDEMSGGQQQRVAIARAIVTQPAIVLADEPTANVDSVTAEALLDLMQQLNRDSGVTFLFSTHDQRVMDRARRLITLHDGRIESDEVRE